MDTTLQKLTHGRCFLAAIVSIPGFWANAFYLMLSSFVINILSLALPLVMFQLYDRIIPYKSLSSLFWLMLGAATAVVIESILREARSLVGGWWGVTVEHVLSRDAIHHILYSKTDDYNMNDSGVHLDNINSINDLYSLFSGNVFQVMLDLPFAFLFIYCIWLVGGPLAFVPVVIISLYLLALFFLNSAFLKARNEKIAKQENQFSFYVEMFTGIHSIKSIGMEEMILRKGELIHEEVAAAENGVMFWNKLSDDLGKILYQLGLFAVILSGSYFLINAKVTLGVMTASTILTRRALQPFIMLSGSWIQLSRIKLAINKMKNITSLEPEPNLDRKNLPPDIDGAVIFEEVSYRPKNSQLYSLKEASLHIEPKKFVCISGSDYEATSAFLSLIYGELQPTDGEILIDNYRISRWCMGGSDGVIAYVPHKGVLFDGTVMDNLTMFEPGRETDAMNIASMLDLDRDIAHLPAGYQTKVSAVSNRIFPTSLIQRISLARALMRFPRILLLDRVNQAVDRETERVFQQLLSRLIGKTTIILVTDDNLYIKHADLAYSLEEGKLKLIRKKESGRG